VGGSQLRARGGEVDTGFAISRKTPSGASFSDGQLAEGSGVNAREEYSEPEVKFQIPKGTRVLKRLSTICG